MGKQGAFTQVAETVVLQNERTLSSFISDLKLLLKSGVLISNSVPVFTGFWLALFLTGASFADYWVLFLLTLSGSTLVIAGALVINNWYDADIDRVMDRTSKRPTVTGSMSLKSVLTFGLVLSGAGFGLLFFTTLEAIIYAFIGWFTYVVLYTMWSKRRYTFNTIIGSVSGAVTPLIGWAAVASSFDIVPLILFLILFIWQMPHTYAIAMRKCEEYRKAGVAMLPVVRGFKVSKRHILFYVACLFPLPFFLTSLGSVFVVTAVLMNTVWLIVAVYSLFSKDDLKWAKVNFFSSINYIMIMYVLMAVVTLPLFN
ncbi:heme o synthase [Evansella clarkii]|jgi:protoheme IX farnesyltransferase|uniref:heme o synthase n=1 Tax=Evansella clarkii TaxID=79879 RepID=UPI000B42E7CE|nr:heme o synthase [Evansella clarkii]